MPITSQWPLPSNGIRFLTPQFLVKRMNNNILSKDLYPLAVGYYPEARQHQMRRNTHSNHLLIYCLEGKGCITVNDELWTIKAGDIACLPKNTEHQYHADKEEPWSIYWVHYDGEFAANYNALMDIYPAIVNIGVQAKLIADFEALFALRNAGYAEQAFIHGACQLKQMLTNIAMLANIHRHRKGQRIDLDLIQELMHRNIDTSLDLASLAASVQMSKFHFSRKFKQLTGQSPIQHFIHLKMQHACQLLDSTTLGVKQIASELGYNDSYYFSRLFKQVIGLSPANYKLSRLR